MPKQLSEAAAWRKLAEWCGSGKPDRRAYLCDRLSGWFDDAYSYGPDSADSLPRGLPREAMHERISAHRLYGEGNLIVDEWDRIWGKRASERNHPRVIFCLLMAYECEEEAK